MRNRSENGLSVGLVAFCSLLLGCQSNTSLREDGIIDFNRGQYAQAHAKFERATELVENDYRSHYWTGLAELEMNKPVAAQISLERALALRADDPYLTPDILDALAESYFQQDRPENLGAFLNHATVDYGTSRDYQRQGKYLAKIGDLDNARLALRKSAYFAKPSDAKPYLVIADFYHGLNDLDNELVALRYAYFINPKLPGLADRLRGLGVVPGPTVAIKPPKPSELLR